MKLVLRLLGRGGGHWDVNVLLQKGYNIFTVEQSFESVGGPIDVSNKFSNQLYRFVSQHSDHYEQQDSDIHIITNRECEEITDCLNIFPTSSISVEDKYTPDNYRTTDDLWKISEFIWEDGRYNFQPVNNPEPPYEVYTDASHWPKESNVDCSIGLVIRGCNGGTFVLGSPVETSVADNNVAEYYAVLSAFNLIPDNSDIKIITDSRNVESIMSENSPDPPFDITNTVRERMDRFSSVNIECVSRDYAEFADTMAEIGKSTVHILGEPPVKTM